MAYYQSKSYTLYVGGYDKLVTQAILNEYFSRYGRCRVEPTYPNCGFVHFENYDDAKEALKHLNNQKIKNSYLHIMWKGADKKAEEKASVFVKYLNPLSTQKAIHEYFLWFGEILSTSLQVTSTGESKGMAIIRFFKRESALKCLQKTQHEIDNKVVYVDEYRTKPEREMHQDRTIFVRNLPEGITEQNIKEFFGRYGIVQHINREYSKTYMSYITYKTREEATKAFVSVQSGANFKGHHCPLEVSWFLTKEQVQQRKELRQMMMMKANTFLCLKNLKGELTKERLEDYLSVIGPAMCIFLKAYKLLQENGSFTAKCAIIQTDEETALQLLEMRETFNFFLEEKEKIISFAEKRGKNGLAGDSPLEQSSVNDGRKDSPSSPTDKGLLREESTSSIQERQICSDVTKEDDIDTSTSEEISNQIVQDVMQITENEHDSKTTLILKNIDPRIPPYEVAQFFTTLRGTLLYYSMDTREGTFKSEATVEFKSYKDAEKCLKEGVRLTPNTEVLEVSTYTPKTDTFTVSQVDNSTRSRSPLNSMMKFPPGLLETERNEMEKKKEEKRRKELGNILYMKVEQSIGKRLAPIITGICLDEEVHTCDEINRLIEDPAFLHETILQAIMAMEDMG
eukprot:TRINITY_DN7091_c0_g2_i1.p1 TRINITY_DN7091_c0_g2~~TRINITY_DN7091_c0_g2_i1.p1  ORF type:complete len:625 (-),score=49.07 TRINITY_DN7091_c0_g2_i1:96-1970(-)